MDIAARAGDINMMRFLLRKGAKVNDLGNDGSTALYGAAVCGQVPALRFLLDNGADPRTRIGDQVALTSARDLGEAATAKILEDAQSRHH